ncbi:MAG: SAM-dependent methyltransferase [Firmicutes bacterium HGW-Firmicutes-12]|jgi:tRNA (adenine22-N1)-methyltransferase|nr:MAG: SAM-dependent methyltransferase [Firmicutes bacterium HGW-Firmicutes-12]
MLRISNRLQALAKMVPQGMRTADIGTDHAFLPCYLISQGISPFVIAIDMNEGPFEAARRNISNYLLENYIDLRLGEGLKPLKPHEVEVLVIAGLGGSTMTEILNGSPEVVCEARRVIFQPMTDAEVIRIWLQENGWTIIDEELIYEDRRIFEIIAAEKRKSRTLSQSELCFGPLLIEKKHPLLPDLLEKELNGLQEILKQLAKSKNKEVDEKMHFFRKKENMIKELLICLSAASL